MEFKSNLKGKIEVKGIRSYAYHGLHEFEKKTGGWFETDVVLHLRWFKIPENIQDTLNYETVFNIVTEEMKERKDLIETLCAGILFRLETYFGKQCEAIEVKVVKTQVPLPNTHSTACQMKWEPGLSR